MTVVLAPAEETVLRRLLPDLVRLSPAARLEAVSRLVESMQAEAPAIAEAPKTLADFVGSWADDPDADAMETAILQGRHSVSKPHLEDWD
ncbi:hypothetical protein [Hymenobacter canadensis]|uniref:Addiction module protein n=1 Tax=Hymenobacter canadensis TaxID=2999067 RepID=A0ABY7LLK2_9BACT|nr:hypothetical protein [Hymenobacter canadensis]WBA41330.1 hypothetical protein O3303_16100 [Hymenobacter canadensis]